MGLRMTGQPEEGKADIPSVVCVLYSIPLVEVGSAGGKANPRGRGSLSHPNLKGQEPASRG